MKSCFHYLLFLLSSIVLNSCSNDLEALAEYEETASVYALLDPRQAYQFVKINKVFINPGSKATDIARISDSIFFDTLAPQLVELDNGSVRQVIPLTRANILLKDSGTFANSPNYLYVTNKPVSSLYQYRLEVKLPKTNKLVTATTNMVTMPIASLSQPILVFQIPRIINIPTTPNGNIAISFSSGMNGKIYDAFFNFNYQEISKADTSQKTVKTIRWKILRSYRTIKDKGNENVIQRIPSSLFYNMLLNEIPLNPGVTRHFLPCSIELIGGNQELDNYIQASVPSIGIVQKQTEYTNIKGGIGLFASRNTLFIDEVHLISTNKSYIINDPLLKPLGFQ